MYRWARAARIYDGPDEVHRQTVARHALKNYTPSEVPTEFIPRAPRGREKFAGMLEFLEAERSNEAPVPRRPLESTPKGTMASVGIWTPASM